MARQRPSDYLPAQVLARADFAQACAARDLGAVLKLAKQYGGVGFSASHLARRCELTVSRVQDYIYGRMRAQQVEIFERVADGLHIPGAMFNLGTRPWEGMDTGNPPEGDNVRRRQLLHAAGAELATAIVDRPATGSTASGPITGKRTIGMADVETVRKANNMFGRLNSKFGGGHSRAQANAFLTSTADPMIRHGSYTEAVRMELFSATAELYQLIGWMAYDTGQASIGRRYFRDGLRLCQEAGNDALAALTWGAMSFEAHFAGAAEEAVDLALAAQHVAKKAAIGPLRSRAAVMEAQGLALQGDKAGCVAALRKAEQEFFRPGRDVPSWLGYFDEACLAAMFAFAFRDLRLPEEAERFARSSLEAVDGYERGRLLRTAVLAGSLADQRRVDEACATAMLAVNMAGSIRSTVTGAHLTDVARRLTPFRATVEVRELYEHMVDSGIAVP